MAVKGEPTSDYEPMCLLAREVSATFSVINAGEDVPETTRSAFRDGNEDVGAAVSPEDFSLVRITPRRLHGCAKRRLMVAYCVTVVICLKSLLIAYQP